MYVCGRLSAGAESPLSVGDTCRPLAARGAPADDAAAQAPKPGQAHSGAPAAAHARQAHAHGAAHDSGPQSSSVAGAARGRGAAAARGLARGARDGGGAGAGGGGGRRDKAAAAAGSEQELHCRLLIDCMVRGCVCSLTCLHDFSRQGVSTAAAGRVPAIVLTHDWEQALLCWRVMGAFYVSDGLRHVGPKRIA